MVLCRCDIDQWNVQATVKRINESLIERGYVTWFDLTNMKGITSALVLLLLCSFAALALISLIHPPTMMQEVL